MANPAMESAIIPNHHDTDNEHDVEYIIRRFLTKHPLFPICMLIFISMCVWTVYIFTIPESDEANRPQRYRSRSLGDLDIVSNSDAISESFIEEFKEQIGEEKLATLRRRCTNSQDSNQEHDRASNDHTTEQTGFHSQKRCESGNAKATKNDNESCDSRHYSANVTETGSASEAADSIGDNENENVNVNETPAEERDESDSKLEKTDTSNELDVSVDSNSGEYANDDYAKFLMRVNSVTKDLLPKFEEDAKVYCPNVETDNDDARSAISESESSQSAEFATKSTDAESEVSSISNMEESEEQGPKKNFGRTKATKRRFED